MNPIGCKPKGCVFVVFKYQYRSKTNRLPGWDYASPCMYFVTVCTRGHRCWFGEVRDGRMYLNRLGEIVKEEICKTQKIRNNVIVDSWVTMPNHLHLIIYITPEDHVETSRRGVSTEDNRSWKPGCLVAVVNQFKGACTRRIRNDLNPAFAWQARFYDHVIRTDQDLDHLRWYISRNPANWQDDEITTINEILAHA